MPPRRPHRTPPSATTDHAHPSAEQQPQTTPDVLAETISAAFSTSNFGRGSSQAPDDKPHLKKLLYLLG